MKKILTIAMLVAMVCMMVLPAAATACTAKAPMTALVETDSGYISGTVISDDADDPVYIFRGIPYAAPPVGNLRWKAPQSVTSWSGIFECTDFGLNPSQDPSSATEDFPIGEDCLYLNVQTPAEYTSDKLPVMVWFHGGCYHMGSGNDLDSNSPELPQHGIVLVSVTHRLGVMGLLTTSELSAESPNGVSGNYMVLDLIASLEWVQENIAAFGGDPDNVTIAGFSGGGGKVIGMLASPLAEGLFDKAILHSGSLYMMFPGTPLADQEAIGEQLFAKLGVTTLAQARALDWETVEQANTELGAELNMFTPAGPIWNYTVDGYVFPVSHDTVIREGDHYAVPLIGSCCSGEIPPGTMMALNIPCYVEIFEGNIEAGAESYACINDLVPAGWRAEGGIIGHGNDLPYAFGFLDLPWAWGMMRIGAAFPEGPPAGVTSDAGVTSADIQDAEDMMTIWVQFMKTGDPSVSGLIDWPAWDASGDKYVEIGYPIQVKSGYSLVSQ